MRHASEFFLTFSNGIIALYKSLIQSFGESLIYELIPMSDSDSGCGQGIKWSLGVESSSFISGDGPLCFGETQ